VECRAASRQIVIIHSFLKQETNGRLELVGKLTWSRRKRNFMERKNPSSLAQYTLVIEIDARFMALLRRFFDDKKSHFEENPNVDSRDKHDPAISPSEDLVPPSPGGIKDRADMEKKLLPFTSYSLWLTIVIKRCWKIPVSKPKTAPKISHTF
jgi:hypothetical protein